MSDSAILAAWERRAAAHLAIHHGCNLSDEDAAPLWAEIGAADAIIGEIVAASLPEIALQIWTVLHAADAYPPEDAARILDRDLAYVVEHKTDCDWQYRPLVAALQGIQALGQA